MIRVICGLILAVALLPGAALGQDVSVYTNVYDESGANDRKKPMPTAQSLTVFHAGKAYDYLPVIDEVIVFDPANHRFTILNTARTMATELDFAELRQMLKIARHEMEKRISQLESKGTETHRQAAGQLRFQLDPKLTETYDADVRQLTLSAEEIRYEATGTDQAPQEAVETYLRYADWMARLNFVLHPNSLYPESRLLLNSGLRKRKLMPTVVRLNAEIGSHPVSLRAEHVISWELAAKDLSLIHHWETMLKKKSTRRVSFRDYQRKLLTAKIGKSR